jgi:hypothetical protein
MKLMLLKVANKGQGNNVKNINVESHQILTSKGLIYLRRYKRLS